MTIFFLVVLGTNHKWRKEGMEGNEKNKNKTIKNTLKTFKI
jgi:hypothetical protein